MLHRARAAVAPVLFWILIPATTIAWEQPAHWDQVGAVATWQSLDSLFYRLRDDPVFLDRSQDKVDQQSAYAKTLEYNGKVDGINLQTWLNLADDEREQRRGLARQHLDYIVNFRLRIENQVQRTRQSQPSGWGTQVADVTTVGDCLSRLRTAVGIDPSNPWTWHLYAWFAAVLGDLERADRALNGADQALAQVPAGELQELRAAVALERAWLGWDRGDLDVAAEAVERAAALDAEAFDVILLRGLTAARRGDMQTAFEWAARLRQVQVRRFPMDYRTSGSSPELNNVAVWSGVPSDYAERWIKALAWLESGQLDMAAKAFGRYRYDDVFPQAHRFWNDAGMIYELTGREAMAELAWNQARITTPYAPYFPYKPYTRDVGRLTGRPGEQAVFLAFDTFYLAGNRLARAATLVDAVSAQEDEVERQAAAALAFDELDACRRRGHYPAQATLLKGAVYHRLGDLASAVLEVEAALRLLDKQGDAPGYQAVVDQLANVRVDRSPEEIQAFFGQSGASRGRWAAVQDADAELAALRDAYAADGGDESRRALARFLIREGETAEGRELVAGRDTGPDLVLALEADRTDGEAALASELAGRLLETGHDPYNDAELWTLAGFMCLEANDDEAGRTSLERALELDPGNHGLKIQLQLMKAAGG